MNHFILYEGPSMLDGAPIVVIVTGVVDGGRNSATGPMAQVYILRSDINPLQAVQTGDDVSICGSCRHRGHIKTDLETGVRKNVERSCYVVLFQGPRVVYNAYKKGVYTPIPIEFARKVLRKKRVRVGAYGDPAAVPQWVWDIALCQTAEVNSYTHQWRQFPSLASFCMASCDTEEERQEAKARGFRVYRVRNENDPILEGEGRCPKSAEVSGGSVQCFSCMLCGGNRLNGRKKVPTGDITIIAHGNGATHFRQHTAA